MEKSIHQSLQEAYIYDVYQLDEVLDTPEKRKSYGVKAGISIADAAAKGFKQAKKEGTVDQKYKDTIAKRGKGIARMKKKGEDADFRRRWFGEECDVYDTILDYLMDEGYVNNEVSAEVLMDHMSDEWLESILEAELPDPQSRGRSKEEINAQRRLDRLNMKKSTKGSFMKGPNDSFKGKDKVIQQEKERAARGETSWPDTKKL